MFPAACIINQRAEVIKQEALLRQWTVVLALPLATPLLFCSECRASLQFSHVQKTSALSGLVYKSYFFQ